MPPFERHVFVCENLRDAADARGCCAAKGAAEVRSRLKQLTHQAGLKGRVRINGAGCLDQCAFGVTIVVYPEAVWYGGGPPAHAGEIFPSPLIEGRPGEPPSLPPPPPPHKPPEPGLPRVPSRSSPRR